MSDHIGTSPILNGKAAGCADPEPLLIMADPTSPSTAFIDAAGEACGTLTPVIRKSLAPLHAGEVLEVLAHDPAAREGVPAWCRLTGHELEVIADFLECNAKRLRHETERIVQQGAG